MNTKTRIFLAGDSTVQTYKLSDAPICGWGAMLHKYFGDNDVKIQHSAGSTFENCVSYDLPDYYIDNRAMAGRSSRSYYDEGRWADLLENVCEGDYVLMQFAHNDANKDKEERYLTPDDYKDKLITDYIEPLLAKKAIPVLVTAIAMKDFDEEGKCKISFPEYRNKMLEIAAEKDIKLIDLGKMTADYNSKIGEKACKNIYMFLQPSMYTSNPDGKEDTAHLQFGGAFVYAGFVAKELKKIIAT